MTMQLDDPFARKKTCPGCREEKVWVFHFSAKATYCRECTKMSRRKERTKYYGHNPKLKNPFGKVSKFKSWGYKGNSTF
jgi:late competence protein required for DNA uptake (superfamily II DNA/RNA helicase)